MLASCSLFHQALPAPSFGWDSLGAMPVGVHSCASRDPLLSAGQSVCNEETTGEPFLAACPPPPMGGGRSSWQLGPAGWLQAEGHAGELDRQPAPGTEGKASTKTNETKASAHLSKGAAHYEECEKDHRSFSMI